MKRKGKKILLLLISFLLFISCKYKNDIFFDIEKQQLNSCDGLLRNIILSSDNDGISLFWNNTTKSAPKSLKLNNIPKGYEVTTKGLLRKNKFKIMPNTKYSIEKWGNGAESFTINIWTDSNGKVFKTSHPICGIDNLQN
ncbi:hypothetical protein B0A58_00325 [Flavobacterium branchiophilum NBRC 15030 = ATCC 35035]|uniref:Lipoprotein n=1 Tax=Flavobacterium branchiophilum TaxID=55197 RepID=A0A543G3T3_9FLAO|nr:hypothetical protein [Flavobacterium branchiophilum]OXA82169.1 hypothetical protein B0A58_00325 [Flavobacterium branchiophilum NBRC 15030 = ATCC 35035]TQM40725.1 hypothetical protein BC670_1633 [Flavobacterium branchiophilum]GEM55542.1 hypothetical protein FB1_17630 [Flavobacterium branchiophilum NBRC 15030 = ATCC 35035]